MYHPLDQSDAKLGLAGGINLVLSFRHSVESYPSVTTEFFGTTGKTSRALGSRILILSNISLHHALKKFPHITRVCSVKLQS